MAIETSYPQFRDNLPEFFDYVSDNQQVVIVSRPEKEEVAIVSASELNGLLETVHLLRSPNNSRRLLSALNRARASQQ